MESSPLVPVASARPIAGYVGGKKNLSRRICARIDATPHQVFADVFVGMGGVFLRRTSRPRQELINDASRDVANFFRILREHYVQFLQVLRFQLATRAEFERLVKVDPETLTDLQRAARFLYLQTLAFGGKVIGRNFGVSWGRPSPFSLARLEPMLEELHERLDQVWIENLDFEAFIRRYDRPGALFYCDPPYSGSEHYYGPGLFSPADFQRLADTLRTLKGRFILSINDTPEIRDLFAWAEVEAVELNYTLSQGVTQARELIIANEPSSADIVGSG
ncbi:DNA adenine methylase [Phenylobacterium sp.]|uniref:DNA adenine methylase n=1 Tax=Phenylobacterium sp. TaxID=1871053 RepID=UPI00301C70E6